MLIFHYFWSSTLLVPSSLLLPWFCPVNFRPVLCWFHPVPFLPWSFLICWFRRVPWLGHILLIPRLSSALQLHRHDLLVTQIHRGLHNGGCKVSTLLLHLGPLNPWIHLSLSTHWLHHGSPHPWFHHGLSSLWLHRVRSNFIFVCHCSASTIDFQACGC